MIRSGKFEAVFGKLFFLPCLAVLLLSTSCEKPSTAEVVEKKEVVSAEVISFPLVRNLRNKEGKEIEVTLVGRGMDTVTFVRASDSRRFTTPIETFASIDQEFLNTLPLVAPPPEENKEDPKNESTDGKRFSSFVEAREEKIEEMLDEIRAIDRKVKSLSTQTSKRTQLLRAKDKLRKEIATLEVEIIEFQEFLK